ncbi:MAG: cob(I)yrinic acid a,c-diamide adenosyltransferase [Thermoplasmata archaeon]
MTSSGESLGKVHVITGPGKGKTTAAFGLAMRAAGHGYRVCVIQFLKTGETTGELISARRVDNIEVLQFGTGRFVGPGKPTEEDVRVAKAALAAASERLANHSCQLLVLDEVNVAVSIGLVTAEEVLRVVKARPQGTEVVLTGRAAPEEFVEYADYVSVIDAVKHPFEGGTKARKGIEW